MRKYKRALAALAGISVFLTAFGFQDSYAIHTSESRRKSSASAEAVSLSEMMQGVTTAATSTTERTTATTATTAVTVPVKAETRSVKPQKAPRRITAGNIRITAESVSCLKVEWKAEKDREYEVSLKTDAPYQENIYYVFAESGVCYITGLRENSEYKVYVTPVLKAGETEDMLVHRAAVGHTQSVEVIQEYPYEVGWTGCFAGERASGLTAMPSSGAISGSFADTITGTGIRRFENGDYCCAMGEFYGECNDRFLVELENGIQFTVRICDSKGWADDADADVDGDGVMDYRYDEDGNLVREGDGIPDGRFHWFGHGSGKCVIEFIYDDRSIPSIIWTYGSWGCANWNGLNLCSNIASIRKINY